MNFIDDGSRKWFVVYTRSHFEKRVNDILEKKDIITFLPLQKGKVKIGKSYRLAEIPLFRSYIFINIFPDSEQYYRVLDTSGVSTIVKTRGEPCPVPSETIMSLKKMVEKMNDKIGVITKIKRGERVRIVQGPLKDAVGELVRVDSRRYKFVVNVDILGSGVEVSIPPEYVSRI